MKENSLTTDILIEQCTDKYFQKFTYQLQGIACLKKHLLEEELHEKVFQPCT